MDKLAKKYKYFSLLLFLFLAGCGFHLQGQLQLPPQLQNVYVQAPDQYGYLVRTLNQYLKASHVQLAPSALEASTILSITQDSTEENLLSVSGTQQTRQYNLSVTVTFVITDAKGRTLVGPQTLTESRVITIQSNQILGSSNEANLYYQQMRRSLASAIMNRIASREIMQIITTNTSLMMTHPST